LGYKETHTTHIQLHMWPGDEGAFETLSRYT